LANSIARKAQEDSQRLETLTEQENYAQFLTKEVTFQDQLLASLRAIQAVHQLLNEAEDLAIRSRIIEAHEKLESAASTLSMHTLC
jgi:centromere/kinetochore protein ZW10